jgi:hypothetical protein
VAKRRQSLTSLGCFSPPGSGDAVIVWQLGAVQVVVMDVVALVAVVHVVYWEINVSRVKKKNRKKK